VDAKATERLLRFSRSIQDPRAGNARHPLGDVLSVAIPAVPCGAEGWAAVEAWGRGNVQGLGEFLELPHGVPSHHTFGRVFGLLDPPGLEACFNARAAALAKGTRGLFVAVDGKAPRRSWKRAWGKTPVHPVGAFASKDRLVPGQVATDAKGNEITAIPKLLAMPDPAGATVTIDAMGCRREAAGQTVGQKGHYVLAPKASGSAAARERTTSRRCTRRPRP